MARNMSNGRKVSRPAQGQNNRGNFARPKPAYAVDNGTPRVVSQGTTSKPVPKKYTGGKRLTPDTTPKIVNL
jgi:hypothetical protein